MGYTVSSEKTGDSRTPHGSPQAIGDAFVSGDAGLNVSDCGRESSNSLIVCPLLEGRKSWLDHGYRLKQVNDPDGPFDNYFYVVSPSLSVKRAALISPNYLPGSTFYEYNKNKTDADVAGFLRAIKQHEGLGNGQPCTGHSGIMKMLVARPANNPRLVIEPASARAASRPQRLPTSTSTRSTRASTSCPPTRFLTSCQAARSGPMTTTPGRGSISPPFASPATRCAGCP